MNRTAAILGMPRDRLRDYVVAAGFPRYRADQLYDWLHHKKVVDPGAMTNLDVGFRRFVDDHGPLAPVRAGAVHAAPDGTRKIAVHLADGATVETVLIPEQGKLTQCVSTQVGCSVGCRFCRSGSFGFGRNLDAAEIVGQVLAARSAYLPDEQLTNVVFMGVGEPLHNYDATVAAWRILIDEAGWNLSRRKVTISTAGAVKQMDRLGRDTGGRAQLAVSLHAADEETRRLLVPGMKTPLRDIVAAMERYPVPHRRRITVEYVLVGGVNDREKDARNLVRLLARVPVKVNLLPLNPHDATDLVPPDEERVAAFHRVLVDKNVSVFLRKRRGDDVYAACGQLLGHAPPNGGKV